MGVRYIMSRTSVSLPVIAAAGGLILLGEGVSLRFALASLLVLGGVLLASLPPAKQPRPNQAG